MSLDPYIDKTFEQRRKQRRFERMEANRRQRMVQRKRDFDFGLGFMNCLNFCSIGFIMLYIWTAIPAFMFTVGAMVIGVLIFENFIFERSKIMQFIKDHLGITALKYKMQAMADFFNLKYKFIPAHGEYSKKEEQAKDPEAK